MQFMYVLQLNDYYRNESNWTEEVNKTVSEHFNYLKRLHEKGVMKLVGKTDYNIDHDDNRGYAIFETENESKAIEIMDNDPCIIRGVMRAKLHPFRIALYNGK